MTDNTRNIRTLKFCVRGNVVTTDFMHACKGIIAVATYLSNRWTAKGCRYMRNIGKEREEYNCQQFALAQTNLRASIR